MFQVVISLENKHVLSVQGCLNDSYLLYNILKKIKSLHIFFLK